LVAFFSGCVNWNFAFLYSSAVYRLRNVIVVWLSSYGNREVMMTVEAVVSCRLVFSVTSCVGVEKDS
jgi:hypothetical protein